MLLIVKEKSLSYVLANSCKDHSYAALIDSITSKTFVHLSISNSNCYWNCSRAPTKFWFVCLFFRWCCWDNVASQYLLQWRWQRWAVNPSCQGMSRAATKSGVLLKIRPFENTEKETTPPESTNQQLSAFISWHNLGSHHDRVNS